MRGDQSAGVETALSSVWIAEATATCEGAASHSGWNATALTPDVTMTTTLSKSSSSYRPLIQAGSGGLAYASGVSAAIALRSRTTSRNDRRFIKPRNIYSFLALNTTLWQEVN